MKKTQFILLIILLLFLNGCKDSATEVETKELLNTLWTLELFEKDGEVIVPSEDQTYNIQFFADSTMKGQSDCNEIFSHYKLNGNSLVLDGLFKTEVYCGKNSKDNIYFEALCKAESYNLEVNKLYIYFGSNSKLTFKEK